MPSDSNNASSSGSGSGSSGGGYTITSSGTNSQVSYDHCIQTQCDANHMPRAIITTPATTATRPATATPTTTATAMVATTTPTRTVLLPSLFKGRNFDADTATQGARTTTVAAATRATLRRAARNRRNIAVLMRGSRKVAFGRFGG